MTNRVVKEWRCILNIYPDKRGVYRDNNQLTTVTSLSEVIKCTSADFLTIAKGTIDTIIVDGVSTQ